MSRYLAPAMVLLIALSRAQADESQSNALLCKTTRPKDQVGVTLENGAAVLDVSSQTGIGGATVELKQGPWPATVIVRMRLRGLESFTASGGKLKLAASVSSHSGNATRATLAEEGKEGERDAATAIKVFDAHGKAAAGLPPEGSYFEITLPKALLESKPKSLEIGWIDFFRG